MIFPYRFNDYVIEKFEVGSFLVNNYLLYNEISKKALLIDAGEDIDPVNDLLQNKSLQLEYIIITHAHADHIHGAGKLKDKTGAKLVIHRDDLPALTDPTRNLSVFVGIELFVPEADIVLKDELVFRWHDLDFHIIHCPGHSPGGIALFADHILFSGDTLFNGSIGRTDFPYSNHQQLLQSIIEKLFILPDSTLVLPGHGPATTIREEKEHNPFI